MRRKFQYKVLKSNKLIYTIGCIAENYTWRMHASKLNGIGMFKIKTYNSKHTCTTSFEAIHESETTIADNRTDIVTSKRKERDHRQATSLISSEFGVGCMSSGLTCTAKEIQYRMSEMYGVEISYKKVWKGKEIATKQVLGSYEGSYNELPIYLHELEKANLGTVTELQVNEGTNSFERCFIKLEQCIKSLILHVRRVLCVDVAHLTGRYKGVPFMATALDGNNHILPVAYGIGESENNSSWRWFFGILSKIIGNLPGLVIVSDRHKGLVSEVPNMFPQAIHGYCAHHILGNMKKACSDDSMREYFWGAVKTYRTLMFWEMMRCIQMLNPIVYQFLNGIEKERWATAFFPGMRYNIVTTNIMESMNAFFVNA
ncbi:uncharacterized protein LOC131245668 [Magnolia sinica]|uniref:uncharacterized protein LOC131245668 n=1 Tax=Magnolia sinica TaxID=86752 RepID=UPI0026584EF4|nr:uncharacterized protein LOC131245668 [Magnolia sinica]